MEHIIRDYLEENVPRVIEDWPPNSPDMNLIENLWAILSEIVYREEMKSLLALKRRIRRVWKSLDPQILQNLVNDMPRRIAEVIAADGGAIDR